MIKKALKHTLNTVCVNEAQVNRMLEVFEKLGMLPPETTNVEDAEIVISAAYFQEHVPQQIVLGWDKE
jgi:hypothetical protein